jgi:hypothetical protein
LISSGDWFFLLILPLVASFEIWKLQSTFFLEAFWDLICKFLYLGFFSLKAVYAKKIISFNVGVFALI